MAVAVGIDLGTTNSVIAATQGGQTTVIPNTEGARTTPSVVAFTPQGDRLVGQLARRQAILNSKGTILGQAVRRAALRRGDQRAERRVLRRRPGPDDAVRFNIQGRLYAPEEISALVLRKLVEDASKFLGERITEAVITVPAYFNDAQRQATKERAGSPAWRSCRSTSPRPRPWPTAWTRRRTRRSWSTTWAAAP